MNNSIKVAISCILIFSIVLCLFGCSKKEDTLTTKSRLALFVEPLSITGVAAASYAIGSTFGMVFDSPNLTNTGAKSFLESEINSYLRGRTVQEVFGQEALRVVAGKLVVAQTAYNSIISFLQQLGQKYNLGANRATIGWMLSDSFISSVDTVDVYELTGFYVESLFTSGWRGRWMGPDYTGSIYGDVPASYEYDGLSYYMRSGGFACTMFYHNLTSTRTYNMPTLAWSTVESKTGLTRKSFYGSSTGDINEAIVLNPGYGWSGDVSGYDDPDTNLDQLVGGIFEGVADTNLEVDGEVIPLDPPQPVETWVPVDDVIDGINQGGEVITDIGNDIGDISGHLDDLGEIGGDIVGELEGVNQGIQTQTGVISGAIDQAVSDVTDAISTQTEALSESAEATAAATEAIADALEDESINWRKFDLRGLFPFCIPFDIYNMLQAFDAAPTAPHVQLPFVIESIGFSYTIDLDFSGFDQVAAVMRQMELIVYGIALAWATSKVIKW